MLLVRAGKSAGAARLLDEWVSQRVFEREGTHEEGTASRPRAPMNNVVRNHR